MYAQHTGTCTPAHPDLQHIFNKTFLAVSELLVTAMYVALEKVIHVVL